MYMRPRENPNKHKVRMHEMSLEEEGELREKEGREVGFLLKHRSHMQFNLVVTFVLRSMTTNIHSNTNIR